MASRTIIVVDGSNLFREVERYITKLRTAPRETCKAYLKWWFDVDRLVSETLGQQSLHLDTSFGGLGTVIFHSRKAAGKEKEGEDESTQDAERVTLDGTETPAFWERQGSAPHTSAMLVDVPGGKQGKETGLDISIVVHLFETMDLWDTAVLFTADSDLVPAVWSLRRRGKRVFCSFDASRGTSRPLVTASQHFLPWDLDFLRADFALFCVLVRGGPLDQFFGNPAIAAAGLAVAVHGNDLNLTVPTGSRWPGTTSTIEEHRAALAALLPLGFRAAAGPNMLSLAVPEGWTLLQGLERHHTAVADAAWYQFRGGSMRQ